MSLATALFTAVGAIALFVTCLLTAPQLHGHVYSRSQALVPPLELPYDYAAKGQTIESMASHRFSNMWWKAAHNNAVTHRPVCHHDTLCAAIDGASNRLVIAGVGYDFAGQMTSFDGRSLAYDAEGRLTAVSGNGPSRVNYFDGEGKRVKEVVGTASTVFVYGPQGETLAEYSTTVPSESGRRYITSDALGSTRLTSDVTGSSAGMRRFDYLPFGEEILSRAGLPGYASADGLRQKFTGKERDGETGLDYFGARYMAAAQGRFTSPDAPFADQFGEDPQSWNLYSYVRNQPLRSVDPDGRCTSPAMARICLVAWQTPAGRALGNNAEKVVNAIGVAVTTTFGALATFHAQHASGVGTPDMHGGPDAQTLSDSQFAKSDKKPGTLGKPDHQQTVKDEAKRIDGKAEVKIDTPGGKKNSRRADATGTNPQTGAPEIVQVYRPTPAGNIPKREKDAAADIEAATGVAPTMVPVRPVTPKPQCSGGSTPPCA